MKISFQQKLTEIINCESMENVSDTPDFILAEYLSDCLETWNRSVKAREKWYGRQVPHRPGPAIKRIYLAGRYTRREELCGYRAELQAMGHTVQARWLDGKHQISNEGKPIGDHGEALIDGADEGQTQIANAALRAKFVQDDWEDVSGAEVVISFTEPPRSNASRGGRHVEFGIALCRTQRIIVIGYRENLFHWLPHVEFYKTWKEAKESLNEGNRNR